MSDENEVPLCTLEDARAIAWSDATLLGIRWADSDDDLEFFVDLILGSVNQRLGSDTVTLRATWAHMVDVDMAWGRSGLPLHGGPALSIDGTFARADDSWSVEFDFGSEGTLRFRCMQLFVRVRAPSRPIAEPGLLQWNMAALDLTQVLCGVISPNMRMIVLKRESERWIFVFVLAQNDSGDRDEIGEVPSEFEALQSGPVDCDVEILVTNEPLVFPPEPERVIYRRREH